MFALIARHPAKTALAVGLALLFVSPPFAFGAFVLSWLAAMCPAEGV